MPKKKAEKKPKQKKTGDHWCTPPALYDEICINHHGGERFGLDPCANEFSLLGEHSAFNPTMPFPKLKEGAPMFNGLSLDWTPFGAVFMNPPYSKWQEWIRYAFEQSQKGAYVVSLLMNASAEPAYHDTVMNGEVVLIRGRVNYFDPINKCKGSPTFGSILSIFRPYANFHGRGPITSWWPQLHQERARKPAAHPRKSRKKVAV